MAGDRLEEVSDSDADGAEFPDAHSKISAAQVRTAGRGSLRTAGGLYEIPEHPGIDAGGHDEDVWRRPGEIKTGRSCERPANPNNQTYPPFHPHSLLPSSGRSLHVLRFAQSPLFSSLPLRKRYAG